MKFKCSDMQVLYGIEKLSLLMNKMIFISHLSHTKNGSLCKYHEQYNTPNAHLMMFISFQVQNNFLRRKTKTKQNKLIAFITKTHEAIDTQNC